MPGAFLADGRKLSVPFQVGILLCTVEYYKVKSLAPPLRATQSKYKTYYKLRIRGWFPRDYSVGTDQTKCFVVYEKTLPL